MQYVQHESFLDSHVRDAKGHSLGTNRSHLTLAAEKGSPIAAKAILHGPKKPDSVAHLYDWAKTLFGRSGVNEAGFAPLTPTTIRDMSDLIDDRPEPHEIAVLFWLDQIMRNPPKDLA